MTKLEIAKEIIKDHYHMAECGLFNTRNIISDPMDTIYSDGELSIDICYHYEYFEVFGLSQKDFDELLTFYNNLSEDE